jgi:hypothetical protein
MGSAAAIRSDLVRNVCDGVDCGLAAFGKVRTKYVV